MSDIEIKEYDFTNKEADEFINKTFYIYILERIVLNQIIKNFVLLQKMTIEL